MAKETVIYYSIQDRASDTLLSIATAGKHLDKALDANVTTIKNLSKRLTALNDHHKDVTVSLADANKELRESKKAYLEQGDAISQLKYEGAIEKVRSLKEELRYTKNETRETSKEIDNLRESLEKQQNRANSGFFGSGGSSANSGFFGGGEVGQLAQGLASAGLGRQVASSMSGAANALIGSAFGDVAGGTVSSVLENTLSGAAMGSIAGPLGTAIGGAIGAATGFIEAETQKFEKRDDAFKQYYNEEYERVNQEAKDTLLYGSSLHAQRETATKGFTAAFGEKGAETFNTELLRRDAENPFSYDDMTRLSRMYIGFNFSEQDIYRQLDALGNVGVRQGLTPQDMDILAQSLGYMTQAPSITRQDLKKFSARGISVRDYIADYFEIDKKDVYDQLKDLDPMGVFEAIMQGIESDPIYKGALSEAGNTYLGMQDMVQAEKDNLSAAMGEAYNAERMSGMRAELKFYNSDTNKSIAKAYSYMGQWQASLENLKEEYQRDTLTAVMSGIVSDTMTENFDPQMLERINEMRQEYLIAEAEGNGAEMGRVLKEAEAAAAMEYNASERYQIERDSQIELINKIREDATIKNEYWDTGYDFGQALSFGLAAGYKIDVKKVLSDANEMSDTPIREYPAATESRKNHAFGIEYVPYDGYPANLHQGERVQTAAEVRKEAGNKSRLSQPLISGNNFYIREESDIDKVASALAEKLRLAGEIT